MSRGVEAGTAGGVAIFEDNGTADVAASGAVFGSVRCRNGRGVCRGRKSRKAKTATAAASKARQTQSASCLLEPVGPELAGAIGTFARSRTRAPAEIDRQKRRTSQFAPPRLGEPARVVRR